MTPVKHIKRKEPFWLGGAAASMAACCTHPLDQTKYRMQVLSTRISLIEAVRAFAIRDGIFSLWTGISASILRQSTYSTTRFALYGYFSAKLAAMSSSPHRPVSAPLTIASAGLAGGIAGVVGNPAEVILVRMCADGAKPPAERFGYKHAFDALLRVGREDGVAAYFRGLGPNIVRSVLMNVSQIATYAEAKKQLIRGLDMKDNIGTHVAASFVAGTVATTVCAPADVLKSRFQNATNSSSAGRVSIVRYVVDTAAKEGPGFLMKGWTPAWLRLAPNTVLTFVFMEKLKSFFIQ
ncbi:putative DIC1-mitochondrial dicarboxylate carrier protein [Lophiostoma macrostomum CBS 122681]|uniref:Putative DIC1-mitochondrial dicarboxylate carrier protein n=1 Tax=Lophiostoma macrostomum CBS 122681 TaxID=1314788 RepID=A0A6A6SVU6_9PLEO|nr:putative DIC1-mitochondrial dicarboxylate carrier protein [Lophiostoma macrostomum CBS 122681]